MPLAVQRNVEVHTQKGENQHLPKPHTYPAPNQNFIMPSSKGEPTDPELREQVREEVKSEEKGPFPSRQSSYPPSLLPHISR